jgi:acetylornithine deacetylase/succinyl-diaminopimelate desuccinylase-like protein
LKSHSGYTQAWARLSCGIAVGCFFLLVVAQLGAEQIKHETLASVRIPTERMRQYSDMAVEWMQQYLQIDTSNPPGNEMRGAQFFKKILDQEGIENQVFEYAPSRADLWAVLPHTTEHPKRPLIFLQRRGRLDRSSVQRTHRERVDVWARRAGHEK